MSTINQGFNDGQSAQYDRSIAKIFLGRNSYDRGQFTNHGYTPLFIPAGTLVGRNTTTPEHVELLNSAGSDGSQFPIGITREDHTIAGGANVQIYYCTAGDVAEEMIVFPTPGDDMNTVVVNKTYRDRIASDTVGIKIVRTADDLTDVENEISY
jgi:hypothetical protein